MKEWIRNRLASLKLRLAFRLLKVALARDADYAWAWQCNVAVPIMDEGVRQETANRAAARIMRHLFDVDTTQLGPYRELQRRWDELKQGGM